VPSAQVLTQVLFSSIFFLCTLMTQSTGGKETNDQHFVQGIRGEKGVRSANSLRIV